MMSLCSGRNSKFHRILFTKNLHILLLSSWRVGVLVSNTGRTCWHHSPKFCILARRSMPSEGHDAKTRAGVACEKMAPKILSNTSQAAACCRCRRLPDLTPTQQHHIDRCLLLNACTHEGPYPTPTLELWFNLLQTSGTLEMDAIRQVQQVLAGYEGLGKRFQLNQNLNQTSCEYSATCHSIIWYSCGCLAPSCVLTSGSAGGVRDCLLWRGALKRWLLDTPHHQL